MGRALQQPSTATRTRNPGLVLLWTREASWEGCGGPGPRLCFASRGPPPPLTRTSQHAVDRGDRCLPSGPDGEGQARDKRETRAANLDWRMLNNRLESGRYNLLCCSGGKLLFDEEPETCNLVIIIQNIYRVMAICRNANGSQVDRKCKVRQWISFIRFGD
jgi:hypothetical protein